MECEICGKSIERAVSVKIEGTLMRTCGACSKLGELKEERKSFIPRSKTFKRPVAVDAKAEVDFVEGYPELIRCAREKRNLTQEELGKLINERASVIARLEAGRMMPDLKLTKKLERVLGIKILDKSEAEPVKAGEATRGELTIGDVIKIKKK
ncbi:MAG: multiprotein bridging factor aMBF1 [Candidatus Hydrothermarchaeales archaeon]